MNPEFLHFCPKCEQRWTHDGCFSPIEQRQVCFNCESGDSSPGYGTYWFYEDDFRHFVLSTRKEAGIVD